MAAGRRGVPAKKVARDFGLDLTPFVNDVMALVSGLAADEASVSIAERRRETCGALWAAILLSLEASALRADETQALGPLLFACLEPTWKKHWSAIDEAQLRARAHKYLNQQDARSQVKTASKIVRCLFDTIQVAEQGRRRLSKRLAVLIGHRMLGDIHRLNEFKMNSGIQISVVTLLLFACLGGGEDSRVCIPTHLTVSLSSVPEARVPVSLGRSSRHECSLTCWSPSV
jgi:hypothetical protein